MGKNKPIAAAMTSLLDESITWAEFGRRHLDPRVAKALTWTLKLERPTLVQSQGIPVALEGKDLLCRARTGSGKTLCYAVPMIQRLLTAAEAKGTANPMGGIVLVPTKELVVQVHSVFAQLLAFCFDVLTVESLVSGQEYAKAELPSIMVTTPSSLVSVVKQRRGTMQPLAESLKVLVVDEADLMFSFGYEDDMKEMCALLPAAYQAMLVSATLSAEVEKLKGLMLHKPVLLKLEEPRVTGKLSQFYFVCKKGDKYLILYTLLKLQLVQGKKLIFVKNVENAYKLKILLERFSISSSVLNAQLPHSSRQNIIESFNQSIIDLLIATDAGVAATGLADEEEREEPEEVPESTPKKKRKLKRKREAKAEAEEADAEAAATPEAGEGEGEGEGDTPRSKKKKRKGKLGEAAATEVADETPAEGAEANAEKRPKKARSKKAAEQQEDEEDDDKAIAGDSGSGAAAVAVVKRPEKKKKTPQFGQRKGREADEHYSLTRGVDLKGVSTVINADVPATVRDYVHRVGRCARGGASGTALTLCYEEEQAVLDKIIESQSAASAMSELKPLPMHVGDAERFRYRVEDQSYRLGKQQIVKYMARELQLEALHSEKLQEYFEANPDDKKALQRAQRQLRESKSVLAHLKSIPSYLVPDTFAAATPVQQAIRQDEAINSEQASKRRRKVIPRRNDPLQTFETGKKIRKPWLTRAAMIEKEKRIDPLHADPENLPPLSRHKIQQLRRRQKVRNPKHQVPGERWREDRKVRDRRKKFGIGV